MSSPSSLSGSGGGGSGDGGSSNAGGCGGCGGVREGGETKEGGTSSFTSTGGSAFGALNWMSVEEGAARRGRGGSSGSGGSGGGSSAGGGEEVRLEEIEADASVVSSSSFGPMTIFSSTSEVFDLPNNLSLRRRRRHREPRDTTNRAMDDGADGADGGDVEDGADDLGWGASVSEMMSESSASKRSQQYIESKLLTEGKVDQKWRKAAARTLARGACGKSTTCVKCNGAHGAVVVLRCNDCSTNGVHYCKACFELNHQGLPQHQIEFTDSQGGYVVHILCLSGCGSIVTRVMKIP